MVSMGDQIVRAAFFASAAERPSFVLFPSFQNMSFILFSRSTFLHVQSSLLSVWFGPRMFTGVWQLFGQSWSCPARILCRISNRLKIQRAKIQQTVYFACCWCRLPTQTRTGAAVIASWHSILNSLLSCAIKTCGLYIRLINAFTDVSWINHTTQFSSKKNPAHRLRNPTTYRPYNFRGKICGTCVQWSKGYTLRIVRTNSPDLLYYR